MKNEDVKKADVIIKVAKQILTEHKKAFEELAK